MRFHILFFAGLLLMSYSCKTKKPSDQQNSQTVEQTVAKGKTLGRISHQYRATGCNTIIVVESKDPLVLIPIDTLSQEIDKDGKEIYFDYRVSRIKNPAGCSHGIPAVLSNISKK